MNETQVKLIEQYGVIVLPDTIDHDAYMQIVESFYFAHSIKRKELRIFCQGMGGETNCALAIADMIQHRGNCVGLLPGQADSCHGDVFLACQKRYVFPLACLGIHSSKYFFDSGTKMDISGAENRFRMIQSYDGRTARIMAMASNKSGVFWEDRMRAIGSDGVQHLTAYELVWFGMARPISELRQEFKGINRDAVAVQGD